MLCDSQWQIDGGDSGEVAVTVKVKMPQLIWLFVLWDAIYNTKLHTEWMNVKEITKAYFKELPLYTAGGV